MVEKVIVGTVIDQKRGPNDGPIPQTISKIRTDTGEILEVIAPASRGKVQIDPQYELREGEHKLFTLFKYKGFWNVVAYDQGKFTVNRDDIITDKRFKGMEVSEFGRMLGIEIPEEPPLNPRLPDRDREQPQQQQRQQILHSNSTIE